MPHDDEKPPLGALLIDATSLAAVLVDLPEGQMRGMLFERPGLAEVLAEIEANQALWGEKAGITAADVADLLGETDIIARVDALLPAARKLVELLEETKAKRDDRRHRLLHALAAAVERRAKVQRDGATLLAKYQKTREYRSAIARKGARTRRRKAQQALEASAEPTG